MDGFAEFNPHLAVYPEARLPHARLATGPR